MYNFILNHWVTYSYLACVLGMILANVLIGIAGSGCSRPTSRTLQPTRARQTVSGRRRL